MVKRELSDVFCGDKDPQYLRCCEVQARESRMAFFRERLYRRDGGMCQLCGQPVSSGAFQLDHIIPKSKGGAFTWSNLRLAHKGCNSSRCDGERSTPVIEQAKRDGGWGERWTDDDEARLRYYLEVT